MQVFANLSSYQKYPTWRESASDCIDSFNLTEKENPAREFALRGLKGCMDSCGATYMIKTNLPTCVFPSGASTTQ